MIQHFYVHNFRCLENFKLPMAGRSSSLLIGKNGSGKSTVGKALEVLQNIARGTNRVGQLASPKDFSRGRSDVPLRFEIEVVLSGAVFQYNLALELPEGFRELRVAEEKLSKDGNDIFTRDRAQVMLARTATDREAKFLVDWHLVALPVIQEQSESDPLRVFKDWLARMLILAPLPSHMGGDSEGSTLMPNRACTNFGEWFTGLLAHSPAAYTKVDRFLKELMPDLKDIKNPINGKDSRSLSVQFQHDHTAVSLPFNELSDGEKCFFLCALVLAANKSAGPVFCFWDEPDSHLSLSEVGHFVMDLRRSFQAGGQLLVTSHNPEAIRQFSEENTLFLYRHSHLEPTLVRPVSEVPIHGNLVDALIRNDVEP
ncbi:MAG: AAA family ATPase [Pirellulales bacterium]|nr:AAA family ATPase [Pirellulales bacterium]